MNLQCIALAVCIVGSLALPRSINIDSTYSSRIVGGTKANDGAHPYIVSLRFKDRHTCSGIIIDEKYVITAAHCVDGEEGNFDKFKIKAGTNQLSTGGTTLTPVNITKHENYSATTMFNDVAILEVPVFTFGDEIFKIALEKNYEVQEGDSFILAGWGAKSPIGDELEDLQELPVRIITNEECEAAYKGRINVTQFCTYTQPGQGACHRDSGSPLIRVVKGVKSLIGIVSWITPCARGKPDVLSKVSVYFDWFNVKCGGCLNEKITTESTAAPTTDSTAATDSTPTTDSTAATTPTTTDPPPVVPEVPNPEEPESGMENKYWLNYQLY